MSGITMINPLLLTAVFVFVSEPCIAQEEGDLRLVTGGIEPPNSGSLQMFYNEQWGAVDWCNFDPGDSKNAKVACKQLFGVDAYASYRDLDSFWGQHKVPIILRKYSCDGSESKLIDCDSAEQDCDYKTIYQSAFIICDTKEAFEFDRHEYVFAEELQDLSINVNRYTQRFDYPVSSVDVQMTRLSHEGSFPITKTVKFTNADNQSQQKLEIPATEENIADNPTVWKLEFTDTSGVTAAYGDPAIVYIFHDVQHAEYSFQKAVYSVPESVSEIEVTIVRSGLTSGIGSVSVSTDDTGSATGNQDYTTVSSKQVVFQDEETERVERIEILRDFVPEQDETFSLHLSTNVGGTIGTQASTEIIIVDDDREAFRFEKSSYSVSDSATEVTVKIVRDGPREDDGSIEISTIDGTAIADSDYEAVLKTVYFKDGVDAVSVDIDLLPDTDHENEYFMVTLDFPVAGTINSRSVAMISIIDDDVRFFWKEDLYFVQEYTSQVVLTIVRAGPLVEDASVLVTTQSGSALQSIDYQGLTRQEVLFPIGEDTAEVKVDIYNDNDYEQSEEFSLILESSDANQISTPAKAFVVIENDDAQVLVDCPVPCQNGGTCVGLNLCACQSGYSGSQCEDTSALCSIPCVNGGTCIGFNRCACLPGYYGSECEMTIGVTTINGLITIQAIDGIIAVFNNELNEDGSLERSAAIARIQPELQAYLSSISGFSDVVIVSFNPGSIVANFVASFQEGSTVTSEDVNRQINKLAESRTSSLSIDKSASFAIPTDGENESKEGMSPVGLAAVISAVSAFLIVAAVLAIMVCFYRQIKVLKGDSQLQLGIQSFPNQAFHGNSIYHRTLPW